MAARYGTKLVFGLANFIGCVTCMLVPITAYLNFHAMIWLRLLQGFVAGAAWPGKQNLTDPPSISFLLSCSYEPFGWPVDSAQRGLINLNYLYCEISHDASTAQQIRYGLHGQLNRCCDYLSHFRVHHSNFIVGKCFPLLWHCRDNLVRPVALLCLRSAREPPANPP